MKSFALFAFYEKGKLSNPLVVTFPYFTQYYLKEQVPACYNHLFHLIQTWIDKGPYRRPSKYLSLWDIGWETSQHQLKLLST
jgi:hypothetical protein